MYIHIVLKLSSLLLGYIQLCRLCTAEGSQDTFNCADSALQMAHKLWVLTVSEAWCALDGVPNLIQSMMINNWA